jgi:Xaa-Pro aminopeptidase
MICKKGPKTEYGQFMEFETITYSPIDLDGVDVRYLSQVDKDRINAYHRMVYDTIKSYFSGDELEFLKEYTRAI